MPFIKKLLMFVILMKSINVMALDMRAWPVIKDDYIASEAYRTEKAAKLEKAALAGNKDEMNFKYSISEKYSRLEKQTLEQTITDVGNMLTSAAAHLSTTDKGYTNMTNKAIEKWIGPHDILGELKAEKLGNTREKIASLIEKMRSSKKVIVIVPQAIVIRSPVVPPPTVQSTTLQAAETHDLFDVNTACSDISECASTIPVYAWETPARPVSRKLAAIKSVIKDAEYFISTCNTFYRGTLSYPSFYRRNTLYDPEPPERIQISDRRKLNDIEPNDKVRKSMALTLLHECTHLILGTYDLKITDDDRKYDVSYPAILYNEFQTYRDINTELLVGIAHIYKDYDRRYLSWGDALIAGRKFTDVKGMNSIIDDIAGRVWTKKAERSNDAYGAIKCRLFSLTSDNLYVYSAISGEPKSKSQEAELDGYRTENNVALTFLNADNLMFLIWDLAQVP